MDNLLQFLDFTDLNPSEVNHLHNVLYSNSDACVELPWQNTTTSQWVNTVSSSAYNAQPVNGGNEGVIPEPQADNGEYTNSMIPNTVSTTMQAISYQLVPQPNVYVSNVTANVNVHSFVPQTMPYYPPTDPQLPPDTRPNTRRQRPVNKSAPKRNVSTVPRIENPQGPNFQTPYPPAAAPYAQGISPFAPPIPFYPSTPMQIPPPPQVGGRPLIFYPQTPVFIHPSNPVLYSPTPMPPPTSEPIPIADEPVLSESNPVSEEPVTVHYEVEETSEPVYHQQISEEEETGSTAVVESVIVENSKLQQNIQEETIAPVNEVVVEEVKTEKIVTKLPPATAFKSTPTPQKPPFPAFGQRNPPLGEDIPNEPSPSAPKKSFASLFNSSGSSTPESFPPSMKPLARVNPLQSSNSSASPSSVTNSSIIVVEKPFNKPSATEHSTPNSRTNSVEQSPFSQTSRAPSQLPAPSLADDPNLHRLGEFLYNYQLDHKAVSLQPRGLTNRSNYCYINAILQALVACPPFYNLMKALQGQSGAKSGKSHTPIIDSMVQFVNEFVPMPVGARPPGRREKAQARKDGEATGQTAVVNDILPGPAFEPAYVYKMLNSIRNDTAFQVEGRQEDAEEFLSCLLNGLNDEMLELLKLAEPPALSNGEITTNGDSWYQEQNDSDWTEVVNKSNRITRRAEFGKTPMSAIFRGHLRSRVIRAGNESTDNVQPFFTLQLDIEKASSVKEALENLVGKEPLAGLTCAKTNQEVEAWQQVSLDELPLVLLLHLKCFDYKLQTCSKIIKSVEFTIDLKLDQKVLSSKTKSAGGKDRQYKLFAVVYHDGKEATKGHYITDVFHVGYSGWVRYDDATVRPVTEQHVLHPKGHRVPYLLYYRRCDTIGNPHEKNR